jgi:DNA-binding CsgD family transcriptional regulator
MKHPHHLQLDSGLPARSHREVGAAVGDRALGRSTANVCGRGVGVTDARSGAGGVAGHAVAPPVLTGWGVTVEADLVYRALVMHGGRSAGELAGSLGIARERVQAALYELLGFGVVEADDPAARVEEWLWWGHPAESVVATLRGCQELLATARRRLLARVAAGGFVDITDSQLRQARPLATGYSVRLRLAELMAAPGDEYLVMDPDWTVTTGEAGSGGGPARSFASLGVIRLIIGISAVGEGDRGSSRGMVGYGARYRELPSLPARLVIVDRVTALVPLEVDRGFDGGAWEFSSASVVRRLVTFFLHYWRNASVPRRRRMSGLRPTDRERAIIALLGTGDTDAAVATKLGLSVRTIAYTVKELMELYGVRSRFQLGLVLGADDGHG